MVGVIAWEEGSGRMEVQVSPSLTSQGYLFGQGRVFGGQAYNLGSLPSPDTHLHYFQLVSRSLRNKVVGL